jgi:hypothetical protein
VRRPLHDRSLELARRLGVWAFTRWQEAEEVVHGYWEGRWDDALRDDGALPREIEGSLGGHYMEGMCRSLVAAIAVARGDEGRRLGGGTTCAADARPTKDPQTVNPALAFEAQVALAVGQTAAAAMVADELVANWRSVGIRQPHELAVAPWVFMRLGRGDEVLAALEAESRSITPWHEAARRLASGDLVDAAAIFAEIGSVPDEAYARLKAAEAFVATGDRAAADRELALALPAFAHLGAIAWTAEAESLLAESA